jgi:hydroxymethylpyrimidine pyrophosphatase-like HAD family hydrolase
MRYLALACDYDGTIASAGVVDAPTLAALERLRASGRKLILVTGRELDDLCRVFPHITLFDLVVAENGALLYWPATRAEQVLGERPPEAFITALQQRGVVPLSCGRVIVATWHPHETTVVEVIRDLGLELQVIFNKDAVMILPSGVNKATGLNVALDSLGLSPHNVVGVGDAENDHAFLSLCECAVAVANALPMLQEHADWTTPQDHGAGVSELIDHMVSADLADLEPRLQRHHILLGTRTDTNAEIFLEPYGVNVLLAGTSGGGKTTLATGIIERLLEQAYQVCVIDPEGDYAHLEDTIMLGSANRSPDPEEVLQLLEKPQQSVVINLLGIALEDRPAFFNRLLPRLQELRARTGHPHWIVVDETHHLLPAALEPAALLLPQNMYGMMMLTVQPQHVAKDVLALADVIITIGEAPHETLRHFSEMLGLPPPPLVAQTLEQGHAVLWVRHETAPPVQFRTVPPRVERQRHVRKYMEGELGKDKSFYFRGPEGKLNLRAYNLRVFIQLAEGVDDATWLHHLQQGDYAHWFRNIIQDTDLAEETSEIGKRHDTSARESRALVKTAIEKRYTAPA